MSRIAKAPIELPSGVEIKIAGTEVSVKGPKGNLVQQLHPNVSLEQEDKTVTVKLLPLPQRAQVVLAAFDDVVKAGGAVGRIIAAGIIPAGLEMMDRLAIRAAEDFVHAGYPVDAEAILLCELDGTNEEVSEQIYRVREILTASAATEVRTARDDAERAIFWKGRKAAFPAVGRISPDYYCMDGTIPRGRIADVLEEIARLAAAHDLPVANVFHAGDGNLHPLILYDANVPGELDKAESFGAEIALNPSRYGRPSW